MYEKCPGQATPRELERKAGGAGPAVGGRGTGSDFSAGIGFPSRRMENVLELAAMAAQCCTCT